MAFVRHAIDINGCKLSFVRAGKGAPLLYLHGTDGLAEWPAILDTLAERFDVIVPDHPGFGASEAPAWIDDISDVAYCLSRRHRGARPLRRSRRRTIARRLDRARDGGALDPSAAQPDPDLGRRHPRQGRAQGRYLHDRPGGARPPRLRRPEEGRGSRRARRRRQIPGPRHSQPHRQRALRLAAALLQSTAGALAASGEGSDPDHLG